MLGEAVKPPATKPQAVSIRDTLQEWHIARYLKGELLVSTEPQSSIKATFGNSFIGALLDAYNNHYAISIRPDDVWLSIVIALADYVDNHAEEMRSIFVTHQEKEQLLVNAPPGAHTVGYWAGIIKQFSDLINKNTIASIRDFIEPRFTTTTPNDSLIGRVALMGTLKNYFKYGGVSMCGIPQVTLRGTIEDWTTLRDKIDELGNRFAVSQPQLGWWRDILLPIANKFIDSYNGNPNEDFWQSCANWKSYDSGPRYVSGWAIAFSPFHKGNWRLNDPEEILKSGEYGRVEDGELQTSATVEVGLKVNDNGKEYDAYFYAGSIVNTYQADTNTIRPSFDFAMFKVPNGTVTDVIDWMKPNPGSRH